MHTEHNHEDKNLYCQTCRKPTFSESLKTDHKGHSVHNIAKLSKDLLENRATVIQDLNEEYGIKRNKCNRRIKDVKHRNETLFSRNINGLESKRQTLHKIVDEMIDQAEQECRSQNAQLSEGIREVESLHCCLDKDVEFQSMLYTFQETPMTGLDIIEYYEKVRSKLESVEIEIDLDKYCDRLVFRKGKVDKKEIQQMIGDVAEVKNIPRVVEEFSSFLYIKSPVYAICPISNDKAWIAYKDSREVRLLNKHGGLEDFVLSTASHPSFFMVDDRSFICVDYSRGFLLRKDHKHCYIDAQIIKRFPIGPVDVGKALNGNILVALVDELSYYRSSNSQRRVEMVTNKGEKLHTYEFDENRKTPVFTIPIKPIQNFNSNVCVVNQYMEAENKIRGNICVFHQDGMLKFIYSGKGAEFNPQDICCDSLCNIICVNYIEDNVHIIDSDGIFLTNLLTKYICPPLPTSVALHKNSLWVGSDTGDVRVYSYQIWECIKLIK